MKFVASTFLLFILLQLAHPPLQAQVGIWTWMHGSDNLASVPNFGIQGVPSPSNVPPGLHEPAHWTDRAGKFWIFGGVHGQEYGTLWQFDPVTNMWTWIKGPTVTGVASNYGVQGVPSPTNMPGCRGGGCATWIDQLGDLWLFGGNGIDIIGNNFELGDLWRYHIATNEWTWMSGSQFAGATATYGVQGVPSAANQPGGRAENKATWVDVDNNLWLFGGWNANGALHDVWRYNTTTFEWTWMHGSNLQMQPAVYGTQGVPSPSNTPGNRRSPSSWKDCNGDFWLFGGLDANGYSMADLWRFDPITAMWTWMGGSTVPNFQGHYTSYCPTGAGMLPAGRFGGTVTNDHRRLWNFGGTGLASSTDGLNDFWYYEPQTNAFTWLSGASFLNQPGVYGTLGVPAPTNRPGARGGSAAFTDLQGNVWIFGGRNHNLLRNDLWRYNPDPNCPVNSALPPTASFTAQPLVGCAPLAVTLTNASTFAARYEWDFGDGSTSHAFQPSHTFMNPGSYTVQLIAIDCNELMADTATLTIVATPDFPIDLGPDRDICLGALVHLDPGVTTGSYLWSDNSTQPTLAVTQPGTYWVQVTYDGGCTRTDTVVLSALSSPLVDLGRDTVFCAGDTIWLDAGNANATYLWSTGAVTQSIPVTTSGEYGVWVTPPSGCAGGDYVVLQGIEDFDVALGLDTMVCDVHDWELVAGGAGLDVQWSTGEITSTIAVMASGEYWANVSNACFEHRDSIHITFWADAGGPFIPTAFTPNGDGLNDLLLIGGLRADVTFHCQVYDRWGMLVFETRDPFAGWDGNLQGAALPEGVYALRLEVSDCHSQLQHLVSDVSLLR